MLIQAHTNVIENRLICSQGMSLTTAALLTCMSVGETISSTNLISRVCFVSATVLNILGTACSTANMVTRSNRGLDFFRFFLNSLVRLFLGSKILSEFR